MRARILVLTALLAVAVAGCSATDATESSDSGALAAGIGVSGTWTIDVQEPDGSLVSSTTFHNDLRETGETKLQSLLTSGSVPGNWLIRLVGPEFANPCNNEFLNPSQCYITEPGQQSFDRPSDFGTLEVTTPGNLVVLNGTAVAARSTDIVSVGTKLGSCLATVTAETCDGVQPLGPDFTFTSLATPVPVESGQTVAVTVEIGFGTLPAQP